MLEVFIVAFVIVVDQLTKYLAATHLKPIGSVTLIKGVFHLTYTENRGAAFGILQNHRWLFITFAIIAGIIILYYLISHADESLLLKVSLSLILGGAIGNLIDRIRLGYVVDMFHFTLIDYPVFNIADCAVVLGTVLLAYYLLFVSGKTDKNLN